MKYFKKIFVLITTVFQIGIVFAQSGNDAVVPDEPERQLSEHELNIQIARGFLNLYNINDFPYDKIYKKNKNIKSLIITNSFNLKTLPNEIKDFKSLKRIEISGVKLTKFPIGICFLDSLTELKYSINHTDLIPNQISQLKNLKTLELRVLPITEIPKEIGDLKNLENLTIVQTIGNYSIADVSFKLQGISTIPNEIGKLKKLKKLALYMNGIEEMPKEIKGLENLTHLEIYQNNLKSLPNEICQLRNLEYLDLGSNQLTNLPENIGSLTNLKVLNVRKNKLKNLPESINELENLKALFIEENEIPEEELKALKKLLPKTKIYNGNYIE
ncbi:leucine-rich repeat domain-containing protein [Flavobacterium sp.]|uniref:leucine-rich repeat domain-containing protein n=1 Tax=Flavobacterium sp. TaxID=239 RepID=UPI0035B18855